MNTSTLSRRAFITSTASVLWACGGGGGGSTPPNTARTVTVSTLAGGGTNAAVVDGIGTAANISEVWGFASDSTNLYFADRGKHTVRKLVLATNEVVTLAGSSNNTSGNVDGAASTARFDTPTGVALVGSTLYVPCVYNNHIRTVDVNTGAVGTVNVLLNMPRGICADADFLYVADNYHVTSISLDGNLTTTAIAGSGASGVSDGSGSGAHFQEPQILVKAGGNLYVIDTSSVVRKVVPSSGEVTTFAGSPGSTGSTDGAGASVARFNGPVGITSDGTYLFVADEGNHTIRQISLADGTVSTLAGVAGQAGTTDGSVSAARFNGPRAIHYANSSLYVFDAQSGLIRKISFS